VPRSSIARDLIVAILATLAFTWLATTVLTTAIPAFDTQVRNAVHSAASPPLTVLLKFVTTLGGGWFLWFFGAMIVFHLSRENRRREAALFAIAVLGANILDQAMKLAFHRVRPDPYFNYPRPDTFSFPSGHAFVSFCFYLTLAEVLVEPAWPRLHRWLAWTGAIAMTLLIGLSRVYLGVHYPTDVLAGYAGAIAWTSVVRAAHRRWWHPLRMRHPAQ
jgi:undecaprenyl-diphosphatase